MATKPSGYDYTRSILIQVVVVVVLLALAAAWQRDVIYQIYISNQVNAVGWVVNGGILLLFVCGMFQLIQRFSEYRTQELAINRFRNNVQNSDDPLLGIRQDSMVAQRFLVLKSLNRRRANINQNALAATLLASESSRNSFLKFVHNVLILTGVFGTIISLSMSLLGASEILQSGGQGAINSDQGSGLGTMIFGMSTALSTTLTAIIAYLFFGYFYIKLTDTQTFLISKVEEVTATTLMPHLEINQDAIAKDYSDSIRTANELIQRLDESQKVYSQSAQSLRDAVTSMDRRLESLAGNQSDYQELVRLVAQSLDAQQQARESHDRDMKQVVSLLERGFRLGHDIGHDQ